MNDFVVDLMICGLVSLLVAAGLGCYRLFGFVSLGVITLPTPRNSLRWCLKFLAWCTFFSVLFVAMVGLAGYIGFLLWLTTPFVAIMVVIRYRESERRALLWALGAASEMGIPLSTAARAFAEERRDALGLRARALAEALDLGMPLNLALEATGNRLPTDALVAVRTSCQSGDLGSSLKGVATASNALQATQGRLASQAIYLLMYATIAVSVLTFVSYKIVPEMIKIFEGFGMRLPSSTIATVRFEYFWVQNWWLGALLVVSLLTGLAFAFARYASFVHWDPPLLRRIWRRVDSAIILRAIGQGVERREQLMGILSSLISAYPKAHVRRRLMRASQLISAGVPWCKSLAVAGLVRPSEADILSAAERAGNLRWALSEVSDGQIRRFAARLTALQAVTFPMIVILASTVVFAIASLVLLPLIELIQHT